jgi:hypothetical protein
MNAGGLSMEITSGGNQVSTQAAAQASALASLQLLSKTLELSAAASVSQAQVVTPANSPNLGKSIDVMA